MTALDPSDSRPPDGEAMPGECRSVLSRHEIGGAPAVRSHSWLTNRGVCHEKCEPRSESPSTAKCATVFGRLEVLSEKSGSSKPAPTRVCQSPGLPAAAGRACRPRQVIEGVASVRRPIQIWAMSI